MADFYPYLVASLPTLHFGMKPPFTPEQFLEVCRPFIPDRDFRLLRTLPQPAGYPAGEAGHAVIRQWIDFDSALRNELARIRAARRQREPSEHLRPSGYQGPPLGPAVSAVTGNVSPADAEQALDEIRWRALDDLETGHHFDLAVLITYACRLRILQRWEEVRRVDGAALLEGVLPPKGVKG